MASTGLDQSDGGEGAPGFPLQITYAERSPEVTSSDYRSIGFELAAGVEFEDSGPRGEEADDDILLQLRAVRLNVAKASDTVILARSDSNYRYLKSELGLNMIVPTGKVTELRFHVNLSDAWGVSTPEDPVALDGFPHSDVSETALLAGRIRIAIDEALKFLPLPAGLPLPLGLELGPWDFRLGTGRQVNIQFSGGLTSDPEWYATERALLGEFRVAMIVRVPIEMVTLDAAVQAYLRYDPGFWHRADLYTDKALVTILRT